MSLLNDNARKLKINNESRIVREINYIYDKLDKLNLFVTSAKITLAIANDDVAAGEGAFLTCSILFESSPTPFYLKLKN